MKKIYLVLFMAAYLAGCSQATNLTKNTTQKGQFTLRNGVSGAKEWKENLIFDRYTWHHEMTMYYDLLVSRISPTSSFNFWFTDDELKEINTCADFRVALLYTMDSAKISHGRFFEQAEKANYRKMEIGSFKKNAQMHPDSTNNSFNLYQVYGLCKKANDMVQITVNFPGFREVSVE